MGEMHVPFIRSHAEIPHFDVPAIAGERYADWIPDTLDIQERCALAVNGLTGPTDPELDHLLYFQVNLSANPPSMSHCKSDICQTKFMEALPLMRLASGSEQAAGVDPVWMSTALRMVGPDGLLYWPAMPWGPKPDWSEPSPDADHYAVPAFVGRTISAMTVHMLRNPDGPWRKACERAADALRDLAIHRDDYAYFPQGAFTPDGPRPRRAEMPIGIWSSLAGWTTQGLAHFFRAGGYAPAGELAGKLARYIAYHGVYYGPNGEFLPNYPARDAGETPPPDVDYDFDPGPPPINSFTHFQHHMVPLLGLLDYATAAGDDEIARFVQKSFEWAKGKGETTVGYFPENIDNTEFEGSETCEVAGMIGLALKLSGAGLGDYWDDADRWIRNQFAENQMRRADWANRFHAGGLIYPRRRVPPSQHDPEYETVDRVAERNVGAFAGWPTANDFFAGQGSGIMHCCTGNGTRALYYIWEHMLDYRDGRLSVNLLLNRPSPWADVHSHIPYRGQVDVRIKRDCELRIRAPEWAPHGEAACQVDGAARELIWDGRYVNVGQVQAGQSVQCTFPIGERTAAVDIEKQRYILTIKGNTVVDIDPPGRFCPFYERDAYRDDVTRWKSVERFVSDEQIYW